MRYPRKQSQYDKHTFHQSPTIPQSRRDDHGTPGTIPLVLPRQLLTRQMHSAWYASGTYLGFYQKGLFSLRRQEKIMNCLPCWRPIGEHREDFTVFSGLDHRAGNGHGNWSNFLCGKSAGKYSMGQQVADKIGQDSRYKSIELSAGKASKKMSHTRRKVWRCQ